MQFGDEQPFRFLIHDRDTKFSSAFDEVFRAEGIKVIGTPVQAPNANAFAERWMRTVRADCLDRILIVGRRQLEHVLRGYHRHDNEHRPHRALRLLPPNGRDPTPRPASTELRRRDVLGGLIHEYEAACVCEPYALQPGFFQYAQQTVENAKALAAGLLERGFDLVSGGTDNHLLLLDLTSKGVTGKVAAQALDRARITLNYNTVPFDSRKPFDPSGIRLGTPAVTTRGMAQTEMESIARWIDEVVDAAGRGDEATIERIAGEVRELTAAFPIPGARV